MKPLQWVIFPMQGGFKINNVYIIPYFMHTLPFIMKLSTLNWKEIINYVLSSVQPQDMILTLGAGDIWKINEQIIGKLRSSQFMN